MIDTLKAMSSLLHHANQKIKSSRGLDGATTSYIAIQFALQMQENYHANIACLRAFRILWRQILRAWHIAENNDTILQAFIRNSPFAEDQHLEKISFTAQALAAVVGGADQILINSEDKSQRDGHEKRLHLNIQHLLKLESHLHWVGDPAAGSYFLEKLTDDIAEQIWRGFQELEKL